MRSADVTQSAMFSFRTLEQRIPASHPLRKLRVLVDGILGSLHWELEKLYAKTGRPSIPPERLLRASLIQTLYSIRSERQLMQHIDFNLLYRWFVGLDMEGAVSSREVRWALTRITTRKPLFRSCAIWASRPMSPRRKTARLTAGRQGMPVTASACVYAKRLKKDLAGQRTLADCARSNWLDWPRWRAM